MSYDIDGDPFMNPGIREVVRYLRDRGYITVDSGDGQTAYWPECDLTIPYVYILSHVRHVLVDGEAVHRLLSSEDFPFTRTEDFDVQASYSYVGSTAMVTVLGVLDETAERDEALIARTRGAIVAFSDVALEGET